MTTSAKEIADENAAKIEAAVQKKKRSQRPFPACSFEEALQLAAHIIEFGVGKPVRRLTLFDHIGKSPDSGPSRQWITNANKYGLIKGNYASEQLEITPDGAKAVDEELPQRDQIKARVKLAVQNIDLEASLSLLNMRSIRQHVSTSHPSEKKVQKQESTQIYSLDRLSNQLLSNFN